MDEDLEAVIIGGGNDNDIEAVILHHLFNGENNREDVAEFNLDDVSDDECKFLFRFTKDDIFQLTNALRIPHEIRTYKGNKTDGVTGMCMLLRRLAYPNRLRELDLFGYSPQSMSLLINKMLQIMEPKCFHLIADLRRLHWLNQNKLQLYSQAVRNKGAAIPNCWGFIDGTTRAICRPTLDQENYYSGHKRFHCVKYQSVLCPDGIIVSLKGAWPGRRHDAAIFAQSGIYTELERIAKFPNGQKYVLFGDQGYGISELLYTPFTNRGNMEIHHAAFNNSMKPLREAVEWGFAKVVNQFAFLDYRKNQKILLQEIEAMYKTAVVLTNCHTTLYGSQTSDYFHIAPPTLEEYTSVIYQLDANV